MTSPHTPNKSRAAMRSAPKNREGAVAKKIKNLPALNMPEIDSPAWLPQSVRSVLRKQQHFLSEQRDSPVRLCIDMWPYFVRYTKRVLPAFTNPMLKPIWEELDGISSAGTASFAATLFKLENDFDGAVSLYEKHQNEKICCEKTLKKAVALREAMEEYKRLYYGHMLQENHAVLMEDLKRFEHATQEVLTKFKRETGDISYLFGEHWPITREFQAKEALRVFFIRKMSLLLRETFGKPKHKVVAELVGEIFDVQYTENDIIKLTKKVKPLFKR